MTGVGPAEGQRAFAEFREAVHECERLILEWELEPTHERFDELSEAMRAAFRPAAVVADALGEHRSARLWRELADMPRVSVLAMWTALIGHMDVLLLRDGEVGP